MMVIKERPMFETAHCMFEFQRLNHSVMKMGKNSRPENHFKKFLRINVVLLMVGGSFNKHNSLKNPVGLIALALLFIWTLGEWQKIVLQGNINTEISIQSLGSIFSGYLVTTKGIALTLQSRNLLDILDRLSVMWDDQYRVVKNRNVMLIMAKKAYKMTFFYFTSCSLVSAVFHLIPYKSFLYQYFWTKNENNSWNFTTILPTKYPVDISYVGNYIPIIIVEHTITMFFLIYLTSSDTLFCQLLSHLSLHFKLLRNDLENVIERATFTTTSYKEKREGLRKLSKIVKRHNELYSLSRRVEKIFSSIFFVSMLVTSISICISLHRIPGMIAVGLFWDSLGQLSHGLILLTEVAIYCGLSSMLSHESDLVAVAAYNCPWPDLGKRFCWQLQFLMLRSQKTLRCTAYGFFRIDLPQLSTIVSASFTYFTLINSVVKQN